MKGHPRINTDPDRSRSLERFDQVAIEFVIEETGCCSFQKGGVREENAEERDGGAAKIDERLPNCARFCNGDGPGRILGFSSTGRLFEARNFIGLRFLTPASGFVFKEGLEFDLLWKFLVLGCDVLLNDVDIVYLQNSCTTPAQEYDLRVSDGFDDPTAYGYDDVSEDPSMA
ncbi:uncharacterized protein [Physcomitrium patens]|uniref:uncharacterized protein n=1 Tax=Physcomitrium patens TaxID=3218 RepID=UPI003CCD90B7